MTKTHAKKATHIGERSVMQSIQEYGRGIAGGILFSMPLLYTQEMWDFGHTLSPLRLLLGFLGSYALLLGYNRYAGLRADASWWEVAIDSVEELGIGIVIATLVLWLLGELTSSAQPSEIFGKIIVEALTVAIGVSVGTAQLGGGSQDNAGMDSNIERSTNQRFGGQVVIALCGAVLFAANVAPTEEVILIGFGASPNRILMLAVFSLLLSTLVLYLSDFRGSRSVQSDTGWQSVLVGVVITYAVALGTSAIILWFFNRYDGLGFTTALNATVVLAVAGTLGASAGRLLLQAGNS